MGLVDKFKSYFVRENTIIKYSEQQVYEAFDTTYEAISTIARCVDLIVNTAATVDFKIVKDIGNFDVPAKHANFEKLLNNPSKDTGKFDYYRGCYRDQIYSGNTFLYNIGSELQHLTYVDYDPYPRVKDKPLETNRLIHNKLLNDVDSKYGKPYISRIDKELNLISKMLSFSSNYFRNGGLPGAILEAENPLSSNQRERIAEEFMNMYAISRGANSKPFVSDAGLKYKSIQHNMRDMQFAEGISDITSRICAGLGVNEVLLYSGNNANISMNYKMFVYTTVAPFVNNLCSDLTRHLHTFYKGTSDLKVVPNFDTLLFLQDDKLKQVNSVKTLVTTGLLTINEGRQELKYQKSSNPICDEHLIPQNITGANFEPSPGTPNEEE